MRYNEAEVIKLEMPTFNEALLIISQSGGLIGTGERSNVLVVKEWVPKLLQNNGIAFEKTDFEGRPDAG